ncbi:hypothetical protein [Paractinoplanes ferrugineus]|nr:hypothetical protein [Actinoplanes ferrugineus]
MTPEEPEKDPDGVRDPALLADRGVLRLGAQNPQPLPLGKLG